MPTTIKRALGPLLVIALGVGGYAALHATAPQPSQTPSQARPITVYAARASSENVVLDVITQGEVRAATELDLVAQVGGRISWVSPEFTGGGRIEPGAALVRIEDTDYRLSLREAQAEVAAAEVKVQQALADADVARKQLRDDPGASDLALKRPQVAEARARLLAARARLEQAELDLQRTRITLPFSGRFLSTGADVGQYVSPGSVLGRAFSTARAEIRLPLSDAQLASLNLPIGYSATDDAHPVTLSTRVAGREHQWQGHLLRLEAAVDPETRMLYAMAEVDDPYGSGASPEGMPLAAGLFVDAVIAGRSLERALVIPREALRAGDKVYVIDDGVLAIRSVGVLHRSGDQVVLSNGLQPGAQVIVSAIRNPIRGMTLKAVPEPEQVVWND